MTHDPRRTTLLLLFLAACGGAGTGAKTAAADSAHRADTLTTRQKDSALAKSAIPGAHAIGAAMRAADSTSAHINALDTVGQN